MENEEPSPVADIMQQALLKVVAFRAQKGGRIIKLAELKALFCSEVGHRNITLSI